MTTPIVKTIYSTIHLFFILPIFIYHLSEKVNKQKFTGVKY